MASLTISTLRRYPVKAMGGESPPSLELDTRGVAGDRGHAVVDDDGRLASGKDSRRFRRRDTVFEYAAHTLSNGEIEVRRGERVWRVGDAALDAELSEHLAAPVRVLPEREAPFHDGGAVSLVGTATLEWCRSQLAVDPDPRRLRVNLVVRTEEPFEEEAWLGREVAIDGGPAARGADGARLRGVERIERCRTIDLAQDGVDTTTRWLQALGAERELCVGIYADVVRPGVVRVGDAVTVS